jgi:lysophospholipase L1-like esterase
MKKLWYIVLFYLVLSACSNKVYSDTVLEPTKSFTPPFAALPTKLPTLTETVRPTETFAPTKTPQPTETITPAVPKILLLGDSLIVITKVPTYLYDLLREAGIPAEFVGDETSSGNIVPADGLGGFNTVQMLSELTKGTVWTRLNGTQFPNNFDVNIPDIVVIQLGTNDAINASEGSWNPVPTYRKYMQRIIEFLRSKNQNVQIVVSMLIPSQWPEYTAKIDLINSTIPNFVEMMDTPDSPVVTTINLKDTWGVSDSCDYVHPNNAGSQKIAQAYFDALVSNHLVSVR